MRIFIFFMATLLSACSASKSEHASPDVSDPAPVAKPVEPKTTPSEESEAEHKEGAIWTAYKIKDLPDLEKRIEPSEYALWMCRYEQLLAQAQGDVIEMTLPLPSGLVLFQLENSGTMSPELAAKFPDIKSYKGASSDGKVHARIDTNEKGLFAEFRTETAKYLLSPLLKGSKVYYALYTEDALPANPRDETYK